MDTDLTASTPRDVRPWATHADPALSWSAIFAGAVVALAVAGLLTTLAAGFDLSLGFADLETRGSLAAFTPELGAFAIAVQVLSAALGGYLAGRLRRNWSAVHDDEAHFRDTAHGLIAWAVATVAGLVLAAGLMAPYAQQLTAPAPALLIPTPSEALRAANIAAQSSFFVAVGMLLSAFVAAVAARLGGLRNDEMHAKVRP